MSRKADAGKQIMWVFDDNLATIFQRCHGRVVRKLDCGAQGRTFEPCSGQ